MTDNTAKPPPAPYTQTESKWIAVAAQQAGIIAMLREVTSGSLPEADQLQHVRSILAHAPELVAHLVGK